MIDTQTFAYRIGGEWQQGAAATRFEDRNPANLDDLILAAPLADAAQLRAAVDAAEAGFATWRAMGALARAEIMARAARLLRDELDAHAALISRENGKTLAEARVEVDKSAEFLSFYAATARLPQGGLLADARPGTQGMQVVEPVGIVAMITPWNDPMLTPARKLGPALISGNAVILKPARDTPLAAWLLVRALVEAGLPDGVVNLVMGGHADFEREVLDDPRVQAVTFTGSTSVGLKLGRHLGGRNVRLQTEMGGKNAAVVLADADLDLVVQTVVAAAFGQAGQRCTATSRLIVEAAVYEPLLRKLAPAVAALRVGPGDAEGTGVCPLVSPAQRDEVLGHLQRAREHGGRLLAGGGAPQDAALARGCYVQPTLIADITRDMPLWRDEVFGPVLAVTPVADFEQAVAAVNDSEYGLSAAVFTQSLRAAHRFIAAVDAGQVAVNLPTSGWDVHHPFGGFKTSGSAFKEQGLEGLRFYTRTKMVAIRFDV